LQLAMSWLASKAVISSVIAGATSEQQVIANAQGVAWKLSDDDMNHIDELTRR
jgi:aryl-alcohol dehydrogenase-like predicted oxidoreductase